MYSNHPIHDLPPELKLEIIDHVSLDFPSLKALFQSRLWHRDCGFYIQKQVFGNIVLGLSQGGFNREFSPKQTIPTETVLSSLERISRLRTYMSTMWVQGDIRRTLSLDTWTKLSRLAALIPDMSHLERISLNDIKPSVFSHSVINAFVSCASLRAVAFQACSFSLQDIVNVLHSVPSLEALHFGLVTVRLQNGVSLDNNEQGVSLKELRFTRLDAYGIGSSALHLWDFLATSGVLREVDTLNLTAWNLNAVTHSRLQAMVNLTRRKLIINGVMRLFVDDGQPINSQLKGPIHPTLHLNNINSYEFTVTVNINQPHYDVYGLDKQLLLWHIRVMNTSRQLEGLVIHFVLGSVYPVPESHDGETWAELDNALTAARELRVLLLDFQGGPSDRLQDLRKGMTAWILKRLPRAATKFALSEELGWHWNKGRQGCLNFWCRTFVVSPLAAGSQIAYSIGGWCGIHGRACPTD